MSFPGLNRSRQALLGCVQISSRFIGLSNVSVAFLALSLHLLTGVLSWRDCLEYTPAWDTLLWFGVVIGMSTNLNTLVRTTHNTDIHYLQGCPILLWLCIFWSWHKVPDLGELLWGL